MAKTFKDPDGTTLTGDIATDDTGTFLKVSRGKDELVRFYLPSSYPAGDDFNFISVDKLSDGTYKGTVEMLTKCVEQFTVIDHDEETDEEGNVTPEWTEVIPNDPPKPTIDAVTKEPLVLKERGVFIYSAAEPEKPAVVSTPRSQSQQPVVVSEEG